MPAQRTLRKNDRKCTKMETTIVYWSYIGITEKKIETTTLNPKPLNHTIMYHHAFGKRQLLSDFGLSGLGAWNLKQVPIGVSGLYWGYIRSILGLYWGYIGVALGLYWFFFGLVLGLYWGYIGIMQNEMETTS